MLYPLSYRGLRRPYLQPGEISLEKTFYYLQTIGYQTECAGTPANGFLLCLINQPLSNILAKQVHFIGFSIEGHAETGGQSAIEEAGS